ncbi:MAG: bifunctional diaminohydroxyphosphoribosylaminopyrimidine deaminase/5-amino-6-(5-phosphoribosylamino)uracil reductase RibD, partial [Thermoanaerobaculia bacterium]|nr:bifunctional diaminohydroxyphosphoribosylaminopyrimidine deaminase/5-amino-6-(5-phosphoribosylamino)uracil reductase RibD [Thermoanaerobaculia bacterium]
DRARGATMWVTLEPCSHHGRTPPCVDALIAAGVRRVVAAHVDPDPRVGGRGLAALAAAGLEVEVGLQRERSVRLNWKYLTSRVHQRPAVTLKWAMSLDGKIATVSGESQWISSPGGRSWSLDQRETHDAILVGSGTILADDPRLNRRRGKASGPITRVVLDRRLRVSPQARLFEVPGPVILLTENRDPETIGPLQAVGAEVECLETVDPPSVLASLHRRDIQSVLIEGGGEIHGAFVAAGTFDRVAVDCAPLLLGGRTAQGAVAGVGIPNLEDAPRLEEMQFRRRGGDVIITGFRNGCLLDLYESVGA